ncbi:MAG: DUF4012 domain-containing protein [Candidatus Magasanikbacteria bacterium]|nr:DUF4012 domain-containing protein [Candidatus Magasanikbacteria bacterium]MBT4221157.1 DUF4012 domain-containing protein [Candidatus Magasanikbacteria bacterium]MBT4350273.1 DUF4012 domain-containing protein [Candidatus Magasanikbacteria bacterium]MBT4541699.1 DUF4012 domain-containing protein [Candidatus Magasanikbacteria bacterium]MBT6253324.1 DUF4012 domain-containing protein [Candidatus Magasanikbacteria bacterium]
MIMFFVLFVTCIVIAYNIISRFSVEDVLNSSFIQDQIADTIEEQTGTDEYSAFVPFLADVTGISKPVTYLFLFQNNTEMRPGGGFIGTYALVRMHNGKIEIIKTEGTEVLDKLTPAAWKPVPPQPILDHLNVDRWFFRDSNWSPDFVDNSKRALAFYKGENGKLADEIDMVVAFTPTVLERFIGLTGPITIDGITFDESNVTETLEYEVEYGYEKRGISFENRKQIIGPFMQRLGDKLGSDIFSQIPTYVPTILSLLEEKHILVYAKDNDALQQLLDAQDWSGKVQYVKGDYLLWTDANLAALKTDHAIERTLDYALEKRADGEIYATAKMTYIHNGTFDWRTTRYRTYARVFVPTGSELIETKGSLAWDRTEEVGKIDEGQEAGKQWFGAFTSIEPGETGELSFTYKLPKKITAEIENGVYTLFVQKQSGLPFAGLTTHLDFGTTLKAATPPESPDKWHDTSYEVERDLRVDQEFTIELSK